MKAEKFITKLSDKLLKEFEKKDRTEYILGCELSDDQSLLTVYYPNDTLKAYDIEPYRKEHKETDRSFKSIAKEIIATVINDIERYEKSADSQIDTLQDLSVFLKDYINNHLGAFDRRPADASYIFDTWVIDGKRTNVIAPDFSQCNLLTDATWCPYVVLDNMQLWDAYNEYNRDQESFGQFILNQMIGSRLDIDNGIVQCMESGVAARFLQPNEESDIYTHNIDADGHLRITYGINYNNHFIDLCSFPESAVNGDLTIEEIKSHLEMQIRLHSANSYVLQLGKKLGVVCGWKDSSYNYGAAGILCDNIMERAEQVTGSKNILVVPITVDEFLIAPDTEEMRDMFQGTVEHIMENNERFLTGRIYTLNVDTKEFKEIPDPQKESTLQENDTPIEEEERE